MVHDSTVKTIALMLVIITVFILSYLFSLNEGFSNLSILILFFGFFLSIILASGYLKPMDKKK